MLSQDLQNTVLEIARIHFGSAVEVECVEEARISALNAAMILHLKKPAGRYFVKIENEGILPTTRQNQIEREVAGLQLAQQAGVPCPTVFYQDCSRQQVKQKYMVAEYVDGDLLWELQETFTEADRARLKEEMAAILAQMNAITSPCFGDPFPGGVIGQYPTWKETYQAMWNLLARDSQELDLFQPAEWDLIRSAYDAGLQALASHHPAGLIHGDLGIHNVIASRRDGGLHIGRVIDFGNALFGPIYANEDGARLHGGWGLEAMEVFHQYGITPQEYQANNLLFSFEFTVFMAALSRQNDWDLRRPLDRFLEDCSKLKA